MSAFHRSGLSEFTAIDDLCESGHLLDDLPAGHLIAVDDLAYKRAGTGLRPYAAADLVGRRTKDAVGRDVEITGMKVA